MALQIMGACSSFTREPEDALETDETIDWKEVSENAIKFQHGAASRSATAVYIPNSVIGTDGGYEYNKSLLTSRTSNPPPATVLEMMRELRRIEQNRPTFKCPSNPNFCPGFIARISEESLREHPFKRRVHINDVEFEDDRNPFVCNGGVAATFRIRYHGRVYLVRCNCGFVPGPIFLLDGVQYNL